MLSSPEREETLFRAAVELEAGAGAASRGAEGHQAGHGHQAGRRPIRAKATRRPTLLRDGTGAGDRHHGLLGPGNPQLTNSSAFRSADLGSARAAMRWSSVARMPPRRTARPSR